MIDYRPEWTRGLSVGSMNVLLAAGCKSKEDVLHRAQLHKSDSLSLHKIYGVGINKRAEICAWLGVKPSLNANKKLALRCINYLEQFGYKVISPDGD